ncbi:MAG: peroxidase [Gemmatimonadaceae bacterium]
MQAVLDDYTTAPISGKERALFAFLAKMIDDSTSIRHADADAVRAAGWSDEALYDAITVCALFQFYNNWVDATGVSDMPAFAYEMSGKRLATMGYVVAPPTGGPGAGPGSATERAAEPSAVAP